MRKYLAEALGTGLLVLGGVGTAVIAGEDVGFLGVALAFGLVLLVLAYAIGPISGCHVNPAVTVGLLAARRIGPRDALGYVVAQVLGAIVGAAILLFIVKGREGGYDAAELGFGTNGYGASSPGGYGLAQVLVAEVVLTFVLVFVVLAATDRLAETAFAGIPIGFALALIHLVGIPIDNTSVNPARSIGPALFAGGEAITQLWAFLVAPLAGGVLAAAVHGVLFAGGRPIPSEESAVAAGPPDADALREAGRAAEPPRA